MKHKKALNILLIVLIFFFVNIKIDDIATMIIFYVLKFTTTEESKLQDMIISAPKCYHRLLDENSIVLKYYKGIGPNIFILKKEYFSKDYINTFKEYFEFQQRSISIKQIIVDGETGYLIYPCDNCSGDIIPCEIYVLIPSRRFMIEFGGEAHDVSKFMKILDDIKFVS